MAKREAPEINAGSMADIAFLLLIFFLVTTTMDKDTAYLRKIPKKVETTTPPAPTQDKDIYKIAINSRNVIQARDSIIKPEDITSLNGRIKNFYLANRDKKSNRDIKYPYYTFGSVQLYQSNLNEQQTHLDNLLSIEHPDENTRKRIDQARGVVEQWREKLEKAQMYTKYSGKKEMPEIGFQAHIRLESFNDTDYAAYVAVQSEVEKAISELRDKESQDIFGITYTAMNNYYQQQVTEDTPEIRMYKKRMELIETLFPLKLIEVKPRR